MFTKSTGYAIQALVHLATVRADDPDRHVQSSELAEATSIPSSFLSKILQQLSSGDMIESVRGRGGGVRLVLPPSEIPLYKIAQLMDDLPGEGPWPEWQAALEDTSSELTDRWNSCRNHMLDFLLETRISHLLPVR